MITRDIEALERLTDELKDEQKIVSMLTNDLRKARIRIKQLTESRDK